MSFITLLMLAVGCAMDAFAVSISNGISYQVGLGGAVRLALPFALGHSLFPVVGYFAGQLLSGPVQALDHWIALILLGYIGIKMAWEAISEMRKGGEVLTIHNTRMDTKTILMQTIATSIDVLAIGIGFAAMDVNIVVAALVMFAVVFCFCFVGCLIGKKFGGLFREKAEIFGGCVLVFIGLKIFLEDMFGL